MNDKWEYKSLFIKRDLLSGLNMSEFDARLNSLGQEGWEVLSHETDNGFGRHYLILKRKIS